MNTDRYPTEYLPSELTIRPLPLSLAERSGHIDDDRKARLHRPGKKRDDKVMSRREKDGIRERVKEMQNLQAPISRGDADKMVERFINRILETVNYDMRYRKQKQSAHSVTGIAEQALIALQAKLESEGYKVTHMFEDFKDSQRKWIVVRFA